MSCSPLTFWCSYSHQKYSFIVVVLGHTCQCLEITPVRSWEHLGCQRLNTCWQYTRQVPYLLYYLSISHIRLNTISEYITPPCKELPKFPLIFLEFRKVYKKISLYPLLKLKRKRKAYLSRFLISVLSLSRSHLLLFP